VVGLVNRVNTLDDLACLSREKAFATPMLYLLSFYYLVCLLTFLWQKIREADYEDQFRAE